MVQGHSFSVSNPYCQTEMCWSSLSMIRFVKTCIVYVTTDQFLLSELFVCVQHRILNLEGLSLPSLLRKLKVIHRL